MLSIFCYILSKAKISHLHAHLLMLENFATSHQLMSMAGYYMSVVNCAIEQLMSGNTTELTSHEVEETQV